MQRLKELRLKNKETQEQIAQLIGITRAAYTNIENMKREPDLETMSILAGHFHTSIDYLAGRTDDPTPPGEQIDHKKTHPTNLGERVLAVLMGKGIEPKIFCENLDALNEEQLKLILDNIKLLASKNHD